jgi:hypothetical protein
MQHDTLTGGSRYASIVGFSSGWRGSDCMASASPSLYSSSARENRPSASASSARSTSRSASGGSGTPLPCLEGVLANEPRGVRRGLVRGILLELAVQQPCAIRVQSYIREGSYYKCRARQHRLLLHTPSSSHVCSAQRHCMQSDR